MPQLAEQALDKTCDADESTTEPWITLTRHDTAVTRGGSAILHGWREPFTLWESAAQRREVAA